MRRIFRFATIVLLAAVCGVPPAAGSPSRSGAPAPAPFTVAGDVALHSFMALSDGHLQKISDVLRLLAATDRARAADWERIRAPLTEAGKMVVPAVLWFALPNGEYWTAPLGRAEGNISDRAYFPRLLAGKSVLGDLVVSKSTSRNTAIVAVPIRGASDRVVGALGASVYLDKLGETVRREMGGLAPGEVFFAIDAGPRGAIHSDPSMIFTDPMALGDEKMRAAFRQILSGDRGTVSYTFRGQPRTMLYEKSAVTGWWYAFGVSPRGR
jgi:hypothetical protein